MGGDDVLEGVEGRMGAAAWLSGGSMPPSEPMVPTAPSSLTADSPAHPLRQYIGRSLGSFEGRREALHPSVGSRRLELPFR